MLPYQQEPEDSHVLQILVRQFGGFTVASASAAGVVGAADCGHAGSATTTGGGATGGSAAVSLRPF